MSKKNILLFSLLMLSLILNIFLAVEINKPSISENSFHLVKPLETEPLDSNLQGSDVIIHYTGLKNTLEQSIKKYNMTGNASVFLQDIRTGTWLGIEERKEYAPASLLKIPIMMAILKKVEREEIKLDDKIILVSEDLDSFFGEVYKKGAGAKMSVWELLKEMILSSDNTAKNALKRQLSASEINAVFAHVGILNPYTKNDEVIISPRDYIRLFKSLYYSTFVSPTLSEKALDLTTDTQEENLISKGVPPEIQVAHKFGMFFNELHDCGIVYHSENPYFLCIMTGDVGITENNQKLIIEMSKTIFEFVDKQNFEAS